MGFRYLLVVHWWHYENTVAFLRFLINPWEFRCIPKVVCDRYSLEFWNHHKKILQIQDGNWKAEIHSRIMQKYITKDFSGAPSVILLRFCLVSVTPSGTFLEISLWNAVEASFTFLQVFFFNISPIYLGILPCFIPKIPSWQSYLSSWSPSWDSVGVHPGFFSGVSLWISLGVFHKFLTEIFLGFLQKLSRDFSWFCGIYLRIAPRISTDDNTGISSRNIHRSSSSFRGFFRSSLRDFLWTFPTIFAILLSEFLSEVAPEFLLGFLPRFLWEHLQVFFWRFLPKFMSET